MQKMTQMQQTMMQMAYVIQQLTGKDVTQSSPAIDAQNMAEQAQMFENGGTM